MLTLRSGNLLDADVEALVNTVNTVGVAGKGIALQFRQAYPENFKAYARACKRGEVVPGKMFVYDDGRMGSGRYVINFPTKRHWRADSRLEDIRSGLADLVRVLRELDIRSVAIPPLGCGNGGLSWNVVFPLIEEAAAKLLDVEVVVYRPEGSPDPEKMIVRTRRPPLTINRAAVLALFGRYLLPDYRLTALEAQKLTYFLQECGQPLRLKFAKGKYGPYAENLNHALQQLEAHFIRGYGDRTQGSRIHLLPGAAEEASQVLAQDEETGARVARVAAIIEGFETPYGLELLSTVHWAVMETGSTDATELSRYIRDWSPRKGALFEPSHVSAALEHLRQLNFLPLPMKG
ncbi:Appr-1-p processing protein [Sphaerisporangium melleum]|uniref:Appr-1-p processing protein n=1 Tax=Sphaerisporangium melleum TaxID=321316 RepID=A0A917QX86_9ACTN|nr:macro domain-containing protein [Sphaerisporangium melleum]GGK73485.1 Appr-1-p processing protein [Sphaerisporangium melleum]GII68204.1 Appr-1-p processing protein [Sphaerisporangium melleum]